MLNLLLGFPIFKQSGSILASLFSALGRIGRQYPVSSTSIQGLERWNLHTSTHRLCSRVSEESMDLDFRVGPTNRKFLHLVRRASTIPTLQYNGASICDTWK